MKTKEEQLDEIYMTKFDESHPEETYREMCQSDFNSFCEVLDNLDDDVKRHIWDCWKGNSKSVMGFMLDEAINQYVESMENNDAVSTDTGARYEHG